MTLTRTSRHFVGPARRRGANSGNFAGSNRLPIAGGLLFTAALLLGAGCSGQVAGPSTGSKPGQTAPGTGTGTSGNGTSGGNATTGGGTGTGTTGGGTPTAGGATTAPTTGSGGTTTPVTGTSPTTGTVAACDNIVTSRRVRRLSRREYSNVVTDLLGAPAGAAVMTTLPDDPLVEGFDNFDGGFSQVTDSWQETVSDLAATLSAAANPTTLAPCATVAGSSTCLQTFAQSFAKQAYGRPMTTAELSRASAVAAMGQDYATSVRLIVELVLQSPNLLYVSELGDPNAAPTPGQPVLLTNYEIASQLSFMLSGSRPDATLIKDTEATGFANTAAIQAEATRMLGLDRATGELTRFIVGWMDMGPIADAAKSPDIYPTITDDIVAGMQTEFDTFVATQLAKGSGTLASFMTGTSTNIPASLATIYGTDLVNGVLNPAHRTGILSLPGVLSYHASDVSSDPVERGLLVKRQLLCQVIPAAPAAAASTNPIDSTDAKTTTRQKFMVHEQDPACSGCHLAFDPIGYGFEQMDGIGRFRTMENGLPVDSSGVLSGTDVDGQFVGPTQLAAKLAGSQMAQACMVNHFFTFAQTRSTTDADTCVIQTWTNRFTAAGGHINDLVMATVVDPNFVTRKDDR
jgi:Protein of unknown function (DUF1588)/Protein of unknown function (DUF1592)/Protein of unknown function (DUF1595)/Protein of unknown function (DUF1587)/Protein of unknown function (DUF1585)